MLSKQRRLPRKLFPTDLRQGQVVHTHHFSLRVVRANTVPEVRPLETRGRTSGKARVSVVVSKKVAKSAVDRHLVKRRVYEAVATFEKTTPLPAGAYVFFAKKDAHARSFKEINEEVLMLLAQASDSIVKGRKLV